MGRQPALGGKYLFVGNDLNGPAGFLKCCIGHIPAGRIANPNGGGCGFRMLDDAAVVNRRRAGCLESEHSRKPGGPVKSMVFDIPPPISSRVSSVPHREYV
jgi:hypothetical protein